MCLHQSTYVSVISLATSTVGHEISYLYFRWGFPISVELKNQWLRVSQVFIYPSLLCCISISALISGRWRRVLFVLGFVTNSMEQLWLYECSFGPSFPIESFVKFMLKTLSFEVSFINYLHICLILSLSLSLAAGV